MFINRQMSTSLRDVNDKKQRFLSSMYKDNQLKYLEIIRKELEARKSKVGNIKYRKKTKRTTR